MSALQLRFWAKTVLTQSIESSKIVRMRFWTSFTSYIAQISSGIFIAVCLFAIVAVIVLSVLKIRKINSAVAVVVSSVLCVFISIPLCSSFNSFVESKIAQGESLSKKTLLAEQKKKDAEISALKQEILLLKNAELSMQSMNKICEVALLETALKQIDVQKEPLVVKKGAGILADTIVEESLVIQTHDVNAKFGVDMKKVLVKEKEGSIVISGIHSKYIGSDKNITGHVLSEIRKVESKGSVVTTTIFNSVADKELSRRKEIEAEKLFQERLSKGLALSFMDSAVEKLAENFITAILAPTQKKLEFSEKEEGGVPILEFLEGRISEKDALLRALEEQSL